MHPLFGALVGEGGATGRARARDGGSRVRRGNGEGCAGRMNAQPIRHLESLCGAQVSYRLVCTVPGDEPRTRWSDPCRMLDMDFAESPFYEGR